jgi:hypothetical protein
VKGPPALPCAMHSCPSLMSKQIIIPENDSELMSQSVQRKYCVVISVFSTGRPRRRPQRRPPIGRAIRPNSRTQQTSWKKSENNQHETGITGVLRASVVEAIDPPHTARSHSHDHLGPSTHTPPRWNRTGTNFQQGKPCAPQEATTAHVDSSEGHAKE